MDTGTRPVSFYNNWVDLVDKGFPEGYAYTVARGVYIGALKRKYRKSTRQQMKKCQVEKKVRYIENKVQKMLEETDE